MNKDKIKVLFPEGVETLTITKDDYDRLYGQMTYENIILQEEIDRLNNIISGLEKNLEEVFSKMKEKQVGIGGRGYYYTDLIPIEDILDKLKKQTDNNKGKIIWIEKKK